MGVDELQNYAAIARDITAIVSLLALVIGGVVSVWRIVKGMQCVLRAHMLSTYYRNKDTKSIRQYEAENYDKMYKAYKSMGGNSFIDEITKDVKEWDVVT